jgi:hypothetical protein
MQKNVPNSYAAFLRHCISMISTHFPAVMAGPDGLFQSSTSFPLTLAEKRTSMGEEKYQGILTVVSQGWQKDLP